jgi:hypothetical protein
LGQFVIGPVSLVQRASGFVEGQRSIRENSVSRSRLLRQTKSITATKCSSGTGGQLLPLGRLVSRYAEIFDLGRLLRISRRRRPIIFWSSGWTLRHFPQQFPRPPFRPQLESLSSAAPAVDDFQPSAKLGRVRYAGFGLII